MRSTLPLLAVLAACQPEPPTGPFSACDPLDTALCALPFPSSFYLAEAPTETGYQVAFHDDSLPVNREEVALDPALWNEKDGFSIGSAALAYFDDVSLDGVIPLNDLAAYADDDAKTAIINARTGERVPHFVELDVRSDNPREQMLVLRPVVPLDFATRYVIGIRDLQKNAGGPVNVSTAFAALRDDERTEEVDIEGRRDHFDEVVFPTLQDQGFDREELQLAWDFVTVSRQVTTGRMEWIRQDLYERIGESGPPYTLEVQDSDCSGGGTIARTINGTMTVPLYTELDGPGTLLTRDALGMPFYNGDTQADFLIRIPCSVAEDPAPSFVLQYGHGVLGDKGEAKSGWLGDLANDAGWVVIAADWTGMSEEDVSAITLMLALDLSDFGIVPERTMQGFSEFLALTRLVMGDLADDDAVKFTDPTTQQLVSVIDPTRRGYYGNSQGSVLGGAFSAMSPDIERAVLGVGGTPFTMFLSRSINFEPFYLIFENKYESSLEVTLLLGAVQMLWDPSESMGWTHDMNREPPPGMPSTEVLVQVGIHDAQVPSIGGHVQARAYGASSVAPEARAVFGVPEKQAPFEGSALVEWRYTDTPDEPVLGVPADDDFNTHECPRREPMGQQQIRDFLETGVVNQYCTGVCEGLQQERCP